MGLNKSNTDRGQMLIIGAIGLATLIIALALVLNTMSFFSMSAMTTQEHPDVIEYEDSVYSNSEEILTKVNTQYSGSSYSTIESEFTNRFTDYSTLHEKEAAATGRTATIELENLDRGTLLQQSTEGELRSAEDETEWQLVDDTDHFRNFALTLDGSQLIDGDNLNDADIGSGELKNKDTFRVRFDDDSGNEWYVYFYSRGPDSDIYFRVQYPDGTVSDECMADVGANGNAKISITSAEVNDQHNCPQLEFLENIQGDVDIRFEDAQNGFGTYELTVSENKGSIDLNDFGSDPSATRVAYGAEVRVTYMSEGVYHSGILRVAPEEADGDYYGR